MLSPPSPTEYRPFERAYRNFGEAALDSEDEPQTESEDDADRLAQLRNGRASSGSGDERATEFGDFLQHFPRRGAMPAEVNQVNQDASRLQLESASSSQDTDDLFVEVSGAVGRGVDQLKLEPDSVELTVSLGMGSSADEMAHDSAFLFKPLVAYFDSKEGAVLNGLAASGKADGIQVKADSEYVPLSPSLSPSRCSSLARPLTLTLATRLEKARLGACSYLLRLALDMHELTLFCSSRARSLHERARHRDDGPRRPQAHAHRRLKARARPLRRARPPHEQVRPTPPLARRPRARRADPRLHRLRRPKYRRLVTTEWVHSCVDEEDLVDEDDFKP